MRFLTKVNQFFGFTPNESKVVFFLLITFLAGGAIKLSKQVFPSTPNYAEAENEFRERSERADSLESTGRQGSTKSRSGQKGSTSLGQTGGKKLSPGKTVNLNTASKDDLMQLPGVGEVMAERILIYREENGRFQRVDDLKKVKGIGEKKLERIRAMVTVD
jgi:comEA protein